MKKFEEFVIKYTEQQRVCQKRRYYKNISKMRGINRENYRKKNPNHKQRLLKEVKEKFIAEFGKNAWDEKIYRENLEKAKLNSRKKRQIVLDHYGNKCVCCGETEEKFLTIDHINNNGAKHRKNLYPGRGRGGNIVGWIIKNSFPNDLQLLCYNCNCSKGFWGCCPHQQKML